MPITSTKKRRLSSGFGVSNSKWPKWAISMFGSGSIRLSLFLKLLVACGFSNDGRVVDDPTDRDLRNRRRMLRVFLAHLKRSVKPVLSGLFGSSHRRQLPFRHKVNGKSSPTAGEQEPILSSNAYI